MKTPLSILLNAFEVHDDAIIREIFSDGFDPHQMYEGKPIVYALINMYYRSPKFKDCVQIFVEAGVMISDPALTAVMIDDENALEGLILLDISIISTTYNLDCTFTPLSDVSLLHICAEYNHVACAKVLLNAGADVNAKAGTDSNGFGGQTPVFHTVNQHANNSWPIMELLVTYGADLSFHIKGLIWGQSYEWETFIPSVDPISYAMMGLLRQFQRTETDIYKVVNYLMVSRDKIEYFPDNVPNKYLIN